MNPQWQPFELLRRDLGHWASFTFSPELFQIAPRAFIESEGEVQARPRFKSELAYQFKCSLHSLPVISCLGCRLLCHSLNPT
jgi:hypothetical protein